MTRSSRATTSGRAYLDLLARADRARQPLRIDINVGDPVTPAPRVVSYPALLGEPFPLLPHPIEAVLAEKLVTMVAHGDTTTRDRDFADVLRLAGHHDIHAAGLSDAIAATAAFRQVELRPVSKGAGDAGPGQAPRMAAPDHASRASRPLAIRLHRGHPSGHGLRRSSHHGLGDIRPLGPSAISMDGLAPRGRHQAAFVTGYLFARMRWYGPSACQ